MAVCFLLGRLLAHNDYTPLKRPHNTTGDVVQVEVASRCMFPAWEMTSSLLNPHPYAPQEDLQYHWGCHRCAGCEGRRVLCLQSHPKGAAEPPGPGDKSETSPGLLHSVQHCTGTPIPASPWPRFISRPLLHIHYCPILHSNFEP